MKLAGIEGFTQFFRDYGNHFAVLGGAACSQWLGEANLEFRQTKDIDMVLIVEAKNREFYERLWEYLHLGGYAKWQRADGKKVAFRFVEPTSPSFPFMIELLSRPDIIEVPKGQTITPIEPGDGLSSLSAVLLEDVYYNLILEHRDVTRSGLPAVTPEVLMLLKAKAHLNLLDDKASGKTVREKDIKKHRNDFFHLAYLLDDAKSCPLPQEVARDMMRFVDMYSPANSAWEGITQSLIDMNFVPRSASELIALVRSYYHI